MRPRVIITLAIMLLYNVLGQSFPSSSYLPSSVANSPDGDPSRGAFGFEIQIIAATGAHAEGQVASYELRFATTDTDATGKLIAIVSGADLAAVMTVPFAGLSRESTSDPYPTRVNVFIANSGGGTNPTPSSITVSDLAVPRITPLVSSAFAQFLFTDTNTDQDVFFGLLTLFLDSQAFAEQDTDGTLATINNFVVYPVCDGEQDASAVWSAAHDAQAQGTEVASATELSYDAAAAGCTATFANTFVVFAQNTDGDALSGVAVVLTDATAPPVLEVDLDEGTAANAAVLTPEKTVQGTTLALSLGDAFELQAAWSHANRAQYAWTAFWLCGTQPAYDFDYETANNVLTSTTAPGSVADPSLVVATSARWTATSLLECAPGFTVRVSGTLADAGALATHGPQTTAASASTAVALTVDAAPQEPWWACPVAPPTVVIEPDAVDNVITGSVSWVVDVPDAYAQAATGRRPDYFSVHGSADAVEDEGDALLALVAYAEGQSRYAWNFTAVAYHSHVYVNVFESSGSGATASCGAVSAQISELTIVSAPSPVVAASFTDRDGTLNRVQGDVKAYLPADLGGTETVRVYFGTSGNAEGTYFGTLVASASVASDAQTDADGDFVVATVACDEADPLAPVGTGTGTGGCDLFVPASNTQHSYLHVLVVEEATGLASEPFVLLVVDRRDAYTLLDDLYTRTGVEGEDGVQYYPRVRQASDLDGVVSGEVVVTWTTANLASAFTADGAALMDLSGVFELDVVLGGASDPSPNCHFDPGWEGEGESHPDNAFGGVSNPTLSADWGLAVYGVQASYAQLVACGFEARDGMSLAGQVTHLVRTRAGRKDAAGSVLDDLAAQLAITAFVEITFEDVTHAATKDVSVTNVVVLEEMEGVVETESELRFFTLAFLQEKTSLSFVARRESLFVEHRITTNTDMFFVTLQRAWFSREAFALAETELELASSDAAFANVDDPPQRGRYRFSTAVPIVMNCRPCYLHVQSVLSLDSPTAARKKALEEDGGGERGGLASTSRALVIEVLDGDSQSGAQRHATEHSLLYSSVVALVGARIAHHWS